MKKLGTFLLVFLLVWPVWSQSYSEKTDMELILMLEENSIKLENYAKDLENQVNEKDEQLKELNQQLKKTEESYKNSKNEQTIEKIKIGTVSFSIGFFVATVIAYTIKK